ncbi:flagellar basal body P-ring formation chaperone FlgA [Uliginosibacterium sp. 31-12]|uniref:flagellar basal body P-ring formation chaperone FlgA n=1 Tax=Uliginosibacterium sp. 31-12 TaxID=3062781 RepID=UPI0026E3E203|nr:flagellar basal body P-ring formation chaperone FlgA [Uliginosibacterium sp. 31-12]MDO6384746.1 flagellar basal body P-ring formation chaperone FlgA [Uliginosibacterium sp. 31-12]
MRSLLPGLLLLLSCFTPCVAHAEDQLGPALQRFLEARSASLPGKVTIEIGRYPLSEKLIACQRWELLLPEGSRPWGRISVGARCQAGPQQALYIPSRIKVEGQMLVAARQIPLGATLTEHDMKLVEGELSNQAADVLSTPTEAIGRTSRASIAAGRPLQRSLLRSEAIIEAGQEVRVEIRAGSLQVSNQGIAISSAGRGETLRVRLPNGKIARGIASEAGLVEVQR